MSVFEVVSSGDRRSLVERFNRKSKQQAISELIDIHLMHCTRIERLEAEIEALRLDAERYRWLRERDVETIHLGGVFAGITPDNLVINGEDLDRHIDAAIA